jgi:hypothetical protein
MSENNVRYVNAGNGNWLCRIVGHKHVRSSWGYAQIIPGYCIRCFANAVTPEGDRALVCQVLGHKNQKVLIGDYDSRIVDLNACFRCHAKV